MREKRRLFFKGGVQAEITGLGRERFFNIAARREIFVTGIGTDRDGHRDRDRPGRTRSVLDHSGGL